MRERNRVGSVCRGLHSSNPIRPKETGLAGGCFIQSTSRIEREDRHRHTESLRLDTLGGWGVGVGGRGAGV